MSTNRLFYVLLGIAVVGVMTLTSWEALATKAVLTADRSYDQIEQARGAQIDHTYDAIESMRSSQRLPAELKDSNSLDSATRSYMAWAKAIEEQQSRASDDRAEAIRLVQARIAWTKMIEQQKLAAANVDRSYDAIENLRARRTIQ